MDITFIGGGNMAGALIAGLLKKGLAAGSLRVVELSVQAREHLEQTYGVATYPDLAADAAAAGAIVLAVKPQQLFAVAERLRPWLRGQLVISIAAGVRASDLSRWLGGYGAVVRVMPNTPAMVLSGMSGLFALPGVSAGQRQQADTILGAVGTTLWLEEEAQMDAVTAVAGSGPAYVFYFIEALEEAAITLGLSAAQARRLSLETFLGASRLASQGGEDVATLRARVTSKGGTTERALQALEDTGVKRQIVAAVRAAAERSRELGEALGKADQPPKR